ncbi:4756_t:CDS:2, partial [Paraglomus occultum]
LVAKMSQTVTASTSSTLCRRTSSSRQETISIVNNTEEESSANMTKGNVNALLNWKPTLCLENKASVARDHLANERTFLAWLRTSLSFVSIGIAVTQLFRLNPSKHDHSGKEVIGKVIGIAFTVLGVVFLLLGVIRYFHSQHTMTLGEFPASRGGVAIGTGLTLIILAGCMIVLLVVEKTS